MSEPMPDPNVWAELKAAFAELVDASPAERTVRLERIARERPELAARLETLLAADTSADERLHEWERGPGESGAYSVDDPLGLVGETVGHFRVTGVLGRGGMGIAYRAWDERLDRAVALKFLLPRDAIDGEAKTRLLREARAASALDHPNVCTIFEVGETGAGLFFAMPAYTGETLRDRLSREGPLPTRLALDLMLQLLRGLESAHDAGITHRDLKPGNLIITADGTLKILDFGLATIRNLDDTSSSVTPGTIAYMSPEQLGGGAVDSRTDLWSAGVVLQEMLTGRPPFGSGASLGTPWSILNDDPPPSGAGSEVDGFIARLLAKEPSSRFASAEEALAALEPLAPGPAGAVKARRGQRNLALATFASVLLTSGGLLVRDIYARSGEAVAPSVAVLPFTDAASNNAAEYLGEGVAEEILNALVRVAGLRVPGRRSSFGFREGDASIAEIASQLGVRAVLLGNVQRADGSIRVDARLVDGRTGRVLWSDRWDRPQGDMEAVRSAIVAGVTDALGLRFVARSTTRTADFETYELYLRGLFHWNRRTPQDLNMAVDFFEQAIGRDSTFAPPWVGLALARAVLPALNGSSNDLLVRAEDAASRALALDSTLSDAWAARAYALHWQWRWADAESAFRRAIALNPASAIAHEWYGEHLAKTGRTAEGERMMRQAVDLDPLALVARNDLGIVLMLDRRYDEALAQFHLVNEADPSFALPLLLEHRIRLVMGDASAAAEAGRRAAELMRMSDPDDMVLVARATADPALREQAMAVLDRWSRRPSPPWPDIAMYATLLGDRNRALDALEAALRAHSPHMASLRMVPWFDPLRDDPRFRAILRALAFPLLPSSENRFRQR